MENERILICVRHARAVHRAMRDFDRPLAENGESDAKKMAKFLEKYLEGREPKFYASPAKRAFSTAKIMAKRFQAEPQAVDLYAAGVPAWEAAVSSVPPEADTILFAGHNPTVSEFVRQLAGQDIRELPTCAMGIFHFSANAAPWNAIQNYGVDLAANEMQLTDFHVVSPKTRKGFMSAIDL